MSHYQKAENRDIMIANNSLEVIAKFKYMGQQQIRITFMQKLKVDQIWRMLDAIKFSILYLLVTYLGT
jgi:hypothetical protein